MTKSEWFEIEQTEKSKVKNRSNKWKILIKKKNTDTMNLNINQSENIFQKKNVTQKFSEKLKQNFEKLKIIKTRVEKFKF